MAGISEYAHLQAHRTLVLPSTQLTCELLKHHEGKLPILAFQFPLRIRPAWRYHPDVGAETP